MTRRAESNIWIAVFLLVFFSGTAAIYCSYQKVCRQVAQQYSINVAKVTTHE